MWERTITISSASKSFAVTGFRVGWSVGPRHLIDCLMISHQNGDCVCNTPAQETIARCLEIEMGRLHTPDSLFTLQHEQLVKKRDILAGILKRAGLDPCIPEGSYFILADWSKLVNRDVIEDNSSDPTDFKFAKWLLKKLKIAAIPPSAFYSENKHLACKYIRFCFFKTDDLLKKTDEILQLYIKEGQ